jgi:signal transduction histidine kinase
MQTEDSAIQPRVSAAGQYASRRSWNWWLVPKPFDLVSSLLYLGVLTPFLYSFFTQSGYSRALDWWQVALMLGCITILLTVDRLEYRWYGERTPDRIAVLLFLVRILLIEVICWLDRFAYSPFLYLILLFLGCLYFGDVVGYGLGLLACVIYVVKHVLYSPGWLSNGTERHYLILFMLGCIFAITMARVVTRERTSRAHAEQLFAELARSHQQLKDYSGQVAELATARERNRLAREIHDSLGHYLTVINVQLEKAQVFRDRKPGEADQAVSDAKRLAGEALHDVRRSISALRTTGELPAIVPAITELVEHMQNEQRPIALHIEGDTSSYSPQSLLTLYRAVQEGLTNIQKHAGNCQVEINLCFGKQEATLTVRDTGCGFDLISSRHSGREGRYGLIGVQERLELVGGKLTLESAPGQGTMLRIGVPGQSYFVRDKGRSSDDE